uniref:Chitin-binding type-2 domain-containing protein n=1 Tax=Anopheles epiroticus TaxID=199890 RepID=A0A182PLU6_9DIPT
MNKCWVAVAIVLCCLVHGSLQRSSLSSSSSSSESNENGRPPWVSTGRPPWVSTGRPPINRNRCDNVPEGSLFPAPNCANFITCQGGNELEVACVPEGTLFDHQRLVCDHPEFVTCYSQDNRCTGRENGTLIPAESCSNFIICMNELENEEVTCAPDGTLFDYQREVCDFPENVLCWESDMCAGLPDGSLAPSRNCSNFFICEDEAIFEEITCQPQGTLFDWEREVCDRPENVKCWESGSNGNPTDRPPSSSVAPTRPPLDVNVPNDICRGVTVGMIAHPTDCTQYVICVLGQPTIQRCPDNFIFISELSTCGFGDPNTCVASPGLATFQRQTILIKGNFVPRNSSADRGRCQGQADGTLFPSTNCSNFINCEGGREVEVGCLPEGTMYDYQREVCDHPEFVTCWTEENRCTGRENGTLIPATTCSNFIICMNELENEEVTCAPAGTLFDYVREVCDHPENVQCYEGGACAGRPDGSLAPSRNCSNFFRCENEDIAEEITCQPQGTLFDWQREVCDHPENVECAESGPSGNSTVAPPGSTSEPTRPPLDPNVPTDLCRGVTVGMIEHPTDCTRYVICVLGQPNVQQCPDNFIFIAEKATCGFGDPETCVADPLWLEVYKRVTSYVR